MKFNIGVLLGYIAGTHLEWYTQCYVMMLVPVVFFTLFSFFPESPQHFLKIGQVEVGGNFRITFLGLEFNFQFC